MIGYHASKFHYRFGSNYSPILIWLRTHRSMKYSEYDQREVKMVLFQVFLISIKRKSYFDGKKQLVDDTEVQNPAFAKQDD